MKLTESRDSVNRTILTVTWTGLVANLVLSVLKALGGWLGHSQALIADAVHSLSDLSTDLAIIIGVRFWSRPADESHPHGHRRLETMITLSIGILLFTVGGGLLWHAVTSMHIGARTPIGMPALLVAVISIISKEVLYRWTFSRGRKVRSMALMANAWHHRTDALSSIPVAIAVGVALVKPDWGFLDHVGAAVVSIFIFQAALKIILPSLNKLADASAPKELVESIETVASAYPGVRHVHNIRTRYIGCMDLAADFHIEVDGDLTVRDGHDISEKVRQNIIDKLDEVTDVVVHLEPEGDRCDSDL